MKEKVLVTGGTGFLGLRMIFELMKRGYFVRITVRSANGGEIVINLLKEHGIETDENLEIVKADLLDANIWNEVCKGCDYVLSVASPVFFSRPKYKDEEDAMKPATEGIINVLRAAKNANVKRVIMTSNFGAIGFSVKDSRRETTEEDWTDPEEKGLSIYERSKLLAEKKAWEFIKSKGKGLEFATVNPVAILGPSLNSHFSGSFEIIRNLINGSLKAIPNIPLNVVDVRDVVDIHIRAMKSPGADGQRFIASSDGQISMPEIAGLIKKQSSYLSTRIPSKKLPDWIIRLSSFFNDKAKEGSLLLKINRNIDNSKAKKLLGWKPIASKEEAISAAVKSLMEFELINSSSDFKN